MTSNTGKLDDLITALPSYMRKLEDLVAAVSSYTRKLEDLVCPALEHEKTRESSLLLGAVISKF